MSIEAPEKLNGQHETTPARVKFGPGKTQELPLAWAEFILATMHEDQKAGKKPRGFGDLLALAGMEAK